MTSPTPAAPPTPAPASPDPTAPTPPAPKPDTGFPADTPVSEMTAPQQAAYWKHAARKHENAVKARGDYDELKKRAEQYDELVAASRTEQERAVEAAKEQGRLEAAWSLAPKLLEAHFMATLAGRVESDRIRDIVAPLNPEHFLTADGDIDTDRVSAYADGIAPPVGLPTRLGPPPTGQGQRPSGPAAPTVAAGRDLYVSRHTKTA